ncbi:hypothetical protein IMY05_C4483000700 [Salix suchowensis]|nr:hypothetical protein IMY05_C4483000700 [Salix suchowensis]
MKYPEHYEDIVCPRPVLVLDGIKRIIFVTHIDVDVLVLAQAVFSAKTLGTSALLKSDQNPTSWFMRMCLVTVASELQHRAPVHAHAHHHKHLNRSKHAEEVVRRKSFSTQYGKRALPEGWAELGCMSRGFIYAGVEFGNECCTYTSPLLSELWLTQPHQIATTSYAILARLLRMAATCVAGDDEQFCGGPNRMSVLKSDAEPLSSPRFRLTMSGLHKVVIRMSGVFFNRGLSSHSTAIVTVSVLALFLQQLVLPVVLSQSVGALTPVKLPGSSTLVSNLVLGAVHCGNAIANGAPSATGCDMSCAGDVSQLCGGADRINVYSRSGAPNPPGGGEDEGEPETPQNVPGWAHLGCTRLHTSFG